MDPTTPDDEGATGELINAASSERCSNCQAPLASDQRYCVNCGERRGKARFSYVAESTQVATADTASAAAAPARPRMVSGLNFIAGIATLLLAMGVGVLIGEGVKNNKQVPVASAGKTYVTVNGGGGGGGSSSAGSSTRSHHHVAKTTLHLSKKVTKAVNNAAANVLGSGAKNLAPATVQPGQSCQSGQAGCQGGHFTGNFFGQ